MIGGFKAELGAAALPRVVILTFKSIPVVRQVAMGEVQGFPHMPRKGFDGPRQQGRWHSPASTASSSLPDTAC